MSNTTRSNRVAVDCCHCNRKVQQQNYIAKWTELHTSGDSISPRGSHTATLIQYNDSPHLLIYGGNNRYGEFDETVYLYNIKTQKLQHVQTQHNDSVNAQHLYRSGHVTAYHNNILYVIGGQHIYGTEQSTQPTIVIHDTVYGLDISTMKWHNVTQYDVNNIPLCVGLNCSAAVQHNQYLITVGGATGSAPTNKIRIYTLPSTLHGKYQVQETYNDKMSAREMSSVTISQSNNLSEESYTLQITVSGGRAHHTIYNDMYTFNIPIHAHRHVSSSTIDLVLTSQHPTRCAHALLSILNKRRNRYDVLSLAGTDGQQFYSTVCAFNDTDVNDSSTLHCSVCGGTSQWIEIDDIGSDRIPSPRIAHTLTRITAVDDRVQEFILFGGLNESEDFNDIWLLTLQPKT